jgi:putative DNA primase/helicase
MSALAARAQVESQFIFPSWSTKSTYAATDIIACKNGLLHIPTRALLPHTPHFFNLFALDYDYDPNAPKPVLWQKFLKELWGEDKQSIDCLQEIFGLMLVPNTSY